MRTIELRRTCLFGTLVWGVACSAGSPPPDAGEIGSGGSSGSTGGSLSVGGGSASGGTGGGSLTGGNGGTISVAGGSAMGGTAGVPICQSLSVVPTPQVPTVMLVVDTSSSMWRDTMPQ